MAYAVNRTGRVVPLRADDRVGIDATAAPDGTRVMRLDLAPRAGDLHCLVVLPLLPTEPWSLGGAVWLRMTAEYDESGAGERTPFNLFVLTYRGGRQVGEERLRFFAGSEPATIMLPVPATDGDERQIIVYADRRLRGRLTIENARLIAGTTEYPIGVGANARPIALGRSWQQHGDRVVCRSYFGEHWAEMPPGWQLDAVHPAALAAADWILYAKAYQRVLGIVEPAPDPDDPDRRFIGSRTLLSYSLGTDSTAAMTLLPDDVDRYYCRRPYTGYLTGGGAHVELPQFAPSEARLARVSNLTIVPNTFELLRATTGAAHGFDHNFGYAAVGLLLADHMDVGALAFGSVMEQVFLRSGNLYADVIALRSSSYNTFRRLLEAAGVFFALPTGGCSEVITARIADTGRFAGLAISCPRPDANGTPCGTCFKCFRKERLVGTSDVPDPDPGVMALLEKYPLKSATSVVYAAQRSGYRHPRIDPYRDMELGFLERYYPYAIDHMVPAQLRDHVRAQFDALGIAPMTESDDFALRTVGRTFWPEQFSWARAGLTDPDEATTDSRAPATA